MLVDDHCINSKSCKTKKIEIKEGSPEDNTYSSITEISEQIDSDTDTSTDDSLETNAASYSSKESSIEDKDDLESQQKRKSSTMKRFKKSDPQRNFNPSLWLRKWSQLNVSRESRTLPAQPTCSNNRVDMKNADKTQQTNSEEYSYFDARNLRTFEKSSVMGSCSKSNLVSNNKSNEELKSQIIEQNIIPQANQKLPDNIKSTQTCFDELASCSNNSQKCTNLDPSEAKKMSEEEDEDENDDDMAESLKNLKLQFIDEEYFMTAPSDDTDSDVSTYVLEERVIDDTDEDSGLMMSE
ncbi:hypothetical protein O0L34_g3281 [Tuta absoluta]|nr:hypothetical protein O0L34_g3281 [Tuta absoluta]